MIMESNNLLTAAGFVALTAVCFLLVYRELKAAIGKTTWTADRKQSITRRFNMSLGLWTVFVLAVSSTGFFSDFSSFPPRIMIVLVVPLITLILVSFRSKAVDELLQVIPSRNILRLQVFRVFVEILLWACFVQNLLPVQMTFEGRNFDILSGVLGIVAAYSFTENRKARYAYNFIGLGLLINIVTVAILSMPTPFRVFMNEPSNTLVTKVPFILLPAMLVPLAYGLHFLSLRQLKLTAKTRDSAFD